MGLALLLALSCVIKHVLSEDLSCMKCDSFVNGTEVPDCMLDAYALDFGHALCSFGACYTMGETVNGRVIAHRGCTNDLAGIPYSLPPTGCYRWKGKDISICYELECNLLPSDCSNGKDFEAHLKHKQNPKERGPITCYQCLNYDSKGHHYPQCPKYEGINPQKVYAALCNGTCFTHSYTDDAKKVARGCTDSQWGLPAPLPPDGCYNWDGAVWCVCSADGCNGKPIGQSSGKDLDSGIAELQGNFKEEDGMNRCYECINYDSKGNYYKQCPKHSRVRNAYLRVCNETCFTRSFDYNDDMIARGCTDTQWGLPDPLPPDGCYKWYSEVWCVCSTTRCNGAAIGEPQDIEFDAHIPKGHDDAKRNSPFVTLTLVLSLVCYLIV